MPEDDDADWPMPRARVELCVFTVVNQRLNVMLVRRAFEPFRGFWALPGGVIHIHEDNDLDATARRIAEERIRVRLPYLRQQCTVGSKLRDPRANWTLSVIYRAMVPHDHPTPAPGKRADDLKWVFVEDAMADRGLAFDHWELIRQATAQLRRDVDVLDIPFDYLTAHFTLGELQTFCEVVLGRPLDKSSFRRRIDDRKLVEPIEGQVRGGAHRPAQLYRARAKEPAV